jgi:hypothetical protein
MKKKLRIIKLKKFNFIIFLKKNRKQMRKKKQIKFF